MVGLSFTIRNGGLSFEDGTSAFSGLNVYQPSGQLTVVLGASGCGKTTLLRAVGGLLPFSSGTITFRDADGLERDTRSETGFCFQEPRLLPWLTVEGNIGLRGRLQGEVDRSRVQELLDWVELGSDVATLRPHELSGGMQLSLIHI